ncbi:MAG: PEP/pyruvate-binding domain-containing protein [Candidatus Methanofastidiosia archaeon]
MGKSIMSLSGIKGEELKKVGGKAGNLVKIIEAGFHVPQGFVIPTDVYERFFLANKLKEKVLLHLENTDFDDGKSVSFCSKHVKDLIYLSTIEKSIIQEIDAQLASARNTLWAVRSSATAEDMPEASFAGQHDTFLNIEKEDVIEHVKKCWASYWNERALAYRHDVGIPHLDNGIAVIVQKMVDAHASGVMFTHDPVNQDINRSIVESSWGLGESIVSGIVAPDRFIIDRESGKILEKEISKKTRGIFLGRKGIVDIDSQKQGAPSIDEKELEELVFIGRKIESLFNTPQDIEWSVENGRTYILQSRPITTLEKDDEILWTRAYGDEYWADVTSPLFFSLLGEYLTKYVNHEGSKIMGYKELTDTILLKLYKGHIYFNSNVLEIVFTFNPKFSRTTDLLNYFPRKDQDRVAQTKTKVARRLWAEIRIAALDPDGCIFNTDRAYRKWAKQFVEKMEILDKKDLAALTDEELHAKFAWLEQAYLKHFRLIRYGMVTHSIGTNLMVKRWLVDWLDDKTGELYSKLISGLPDNKTITTNIAIAQLAEVMRENRELASLLLEKSAEDFLVQLNTDPRYATQLEAFNDFLQSYGHRSHTREIFFPRWGDDPTMVVDVLKALVSSPPMDMKTLEKEKIRERIEAEKKILKDIGKLPFGFIKKFLFKIVLKYAQIYLVFRENQRFYLDHQLYRLRRIFMEYGKRFTERKIINEQADIFFLSKEEIFSLLKSCNSDVKEIISRRKNEFEQFKNVLPPKFLKGKIEFDDTVVREKNVLRITGTSASPGSFTGYVRVVESINQLSKIKADEILVTSNTDPGWTPVFAKLGGLIIETGGVLSHGAVVSREYNIPAVTGVKNATQLFSTGQKVTVDGNNGTIYVIEE